MKKYVFIPLNMNLKKVKRAYYNKPNYNIKITSLVCLLTIAYIYGQQLKENHDMSQREFCKLNNIFLRYLRGILQSNFLSPTIKRKIIDIWMPKQTGTLLRKEHYITRQDRNIGKK